MRLEDMLKDISGITNKVVKTNCFEGQNTILDSILLIQTKVNEVIQAINDGIIKGDKGDTPNVQVGVTETLDPNSNASVSQTGDILNPIFNFGIPKGEKGDKGDTGKASESIQDDVISLDTCYSSEKTVSLFNDLKNIQGVKYGNDVGYQVCKGTHNGVVKDIKIYGKSLVNLFDLLEIKGVSNNNNLYAYSKNPKNTLGRAITIFNKSSKKVVFDINSNTNNAWKKSVTLNVNENKYIMLEIDEYVNVIYGRELDGWTITDATKQELKQCCIILDGNHTQNPPSGYFEGIASVGNGNEIEVLSCNKNLVIEYIKGFTIGGNEGSLIKKSASSTYNHIKAIAPKGEFYYKSKGTQYYVFFTDENLKILKIQKTGLTVLNNDVNASYIFTNIDNTLDYMDLTVSYDKYYTVNNIESKQDKKTILFKDTDNAWKPVTNLRGIDENNCDIIENGLYTPKTLHMTINGSENWTISNSQTRENTLFFNLSLPNLPTFNLSYPNVICDKFQSINIDNVDIEGVRVHNALQVRINKSKLSSPDVEGFKKYCSLNNFNVVMLIKEFKSYEINPLFPNSYENETMILFNTGVIPCKNEFYIDSNLGSLQLETLDRMSRIEDTLYKSNVAILRGDFRSLAQMYYPNDFIKKEELPNE